MISPEHRKIVEAWLLSSSFNEASFLAKKLTVFVEVYRAKVCVHSYILGLELFNPIPAGSNPLGIAGDSFITLVLCNCFSLLYR